MFTASTELLKQHWFGELGATVNDFKGKNITVTTHGASLIGYAGAIAFKRQESWVLSVPAEIVEDVRKRAQRLTIETLFSRDALSSFFGTAVERIIGPAWIGQITPQGFSPCHSDKVRLLAKSEWVAFDSFITQNDPLEVEHSALVSAREPTVGVFYEGHLAAAASYELLEGLVAHIGVLVTKKLRAKGFGKQALSLITQIALDKNLGIQYQTLKQNVAAVSAAKALGFEEFAETFAIRLKIPFV